MKVIYNLNIGKEIKDIDLCILYSIDNKCESCQKNSVLNKSINICECNEGFEYSKIKKKCECNSGFIYNKQTKKCQLQKCEILCLNCDNNSKCIKCQKNSHLEKNNNICKCNEGYYINENKNKCKSKIIL